MFDNCRRLSSVSLYWRSFAKFRPEKYYFRPTYIQTIFRGKKLAQTRQTDSNFKKNSQSPESHYDNFQKVAKNIEGFSFFFFALPSYLLCSQIWVNYFLDDRHFGNLTKSIKETLLSTCYGMNTTTVIVQFWRFHPDKWNIAEYSKRCLLSLHKKQFFEIFFLNLNFFQHV